MERSRGPYPEADDSDETLVRRARSGDEGAARALYERHVERFRARVRERLPTRLRGKVAASDVIQDAYLSAFLRLGEFEDRGQGSFSRWIARILENKVRDQVRRHLSAAKRTAGREVPGPPPSQVRAAPSGSPQSPSAVAMAREAREDVWHTIEGLPASHREILRLVHGEGLRLHEAAERLGRSDDAVRKAYHRAVAAFTERIRRGRHEP